MKFKQNKEKERQIILDVDLDESDVAPYYKIGYKKLVKKLISLDLEKGKRLMASLNLSTEKNLYYPKQWKI